MKTLFSIVFFVCSIFISNAQDYRANLNIGMPLNKSNNWKTFNYDIDFLFDKKISSNILLGIGSSYLVVDLLPSNTHFTFDRKILSFYSSCIYEINLSKKIKLLPQFRIGYSFLKSELNEFQDKEQKSGGIYISEELCSTFYISKHIDLITGFSYSTIFSRLESSPDLIITDNYIGSDKKSINQFIVKIGCIYYFKKRL